MRFRLRQSLYFLMRSSPISNAVLSDTLLALHRREKLIFALCFRLVLVFVCYFPPASGNFRSLLAKSCVPYKVLLKFALPCSSKEFSFTFSNYQTWNSRLFPKWMVIAAANPSNTAYLVNTADKLNTPKANRADEMFCSTIHRQ